LMRPKWDGKRGASTYGERTVARALETLGETYGRPRDVRRVAERIARREHVRTDEEPEPPAFIPYPVDVYPRALEDYARAHAAAIGCDVAFVAAPMLAVLGMAVGNSYSAGIKYAWREVAAI